MQQLPHIFLTPPQLGPDYIEEKIVCIRAHKERLFAIYAQSLADKCIIHNYGQAGAGWTFLFGCVQQALELFVRQIELNPALKNKPIAVIGAGCYGLLSAIMLARAGHTVRIVAREVETVSSYKAAGFFFPRSRRTSTAQEVATFLHTGLTSYAEYLNIQRGQHPFIKGGASLMPAYYSHSIDPGFAPYISQGLMAAPYDAIIDFGTGSQHRVMAYQTIFINASLMMSELWHEANRLGITITRHDIADFSEIEESIIFQCAGWGAKKLTKDPALIPVQGHLITLKNQPDATALQYMINVKVDGVNERGVPRNDLIYYAPKKDGILGITFMRGQDSLTSNQHEFDRLLSRCRTFFGT